VIFVLNEYNKDMDESSLRAVLAGMSIPLIRYFETIPSTNDTALEWIKHGGENVEAPDGTLLVADTQTAGRGRMSRKWITEPGSGLAFSMIFRPSSLEVEKLPLFSPLAALAICQSLSELYSLHALIKWPNDVLLDNQKIAGILVESCWLGDTLEGIVIGIGINITPASVPPGDLLQFPATCVESVLGHSIDRLEFLRNLLQSLFTWRERIGSSDFFRVWHERLAFRDRWVNIEQPGRPVVAGIVLGINADGNLRLRGEDGREINVTIGDVRLRLQ
jgi:BirA family biotin operon repressor/biotin-[acetyl-CoA-carboxylase] ligase